MGLFKARTNRCLLDKRVTSGKIMTKRVAWYGSQSLTEVSSLSEYKIFSISFLFHPASTVLRPLCHKGRQKNNSYLTRTSNLIKRQDSLILILYREKPKQGKINQREAANIRIYTEHYVL